MDDFDVGLLPTEEQRRMLCQMMYRTFVQIRSLAYSGASQQTADLADAFHNLPTVMYAPDFSWSFLRYFLVFYQNKYPRTAGSPYDYIAMLERIRQTSSVDSDEDE